VTTSSDGTARIWDARTAQQLAVLSGHGAAVNSAAYSPDGSYIVTASNDGTARIWDARTGVQLAVLSGHRGRVSTAAYSPDGSRIVTASLDGTVRVWDAHIPAPIAAQISWAAAAQTDPLPELDREELGLPPDPRIRTWSGPGSPCDQAAGAPYDPDRATRGVALENLAADVAMSACTLEVGKRGHGARIDYEMGRTLVAKGDIAGAEGYFERAVGRGYGAARVDLADLLVKASTEAAAGPRAVSLYEAAWRDGVPIAAFELGQLYENRGLRSGHVDARGSAADAAAAWRWYRRGAEAGEPYSLARYAVRAEARALGVRDLSDSREQLLRAFVLYAAAAEHAREEDWPDDAWRGWRYRRASLARLLAREDSMQRVADAYNARALPDLDN